MKFSLIPNQGSGLKAGKLQILIVENSLRFGVGSQQHLKATVQKKSVNHIGPRTTANSVRRFVNPIRNSSFVQMMRAAQSRKTRTNNQHIGIGQNGFSNYVKIALTYAEQPFTRTATIYADATGRQAEQTGNGTPGSSALTNQEPSNLSAAGH